MSSLFQTITQLHRPLDFHRDRHNVIASNIANVDTPGFVPQDLVRREELHGSAGLPLAGTSPMHFPFGGDGGPSAFVATPDGMATVGRDGNAVSLEHEMSRLAANDLRYDSIATMVSRHIGMLRYAASDGTSG